MLCCPTLCNVFKRNQIHSFNESGSLHGRIEEEEEEEEEEKETRVPGGNHRPVECH